MIAHEFHEVAPFAALVDDDGYLPLEDHGLIGDGETAALVGRDGAISWLCLPRFDSPPLFCSILDHRRGGRFVVAPDGLTESRQRYEPDTGVLVTEMRAPFGLVRVTDALTLRRGADLTEDAPAARGELLRSIVVLDGEVNLRIGLQPRGGASGSRRGEGLRVQCDRLPDLDLQLSATVALDGLDTTVALRRGEHAHVALRWGPGQRRGHAVITGPAQLRSLHTAVTAAGPDVLRAGAPTLVARLVTELVARGSTTFAVPACGGCGRSGGKLTWTEQGARCPACRRRQTARACGACHVVKPVAARTDKGHPLCARCAARPRRRCGRCGRVRVIARRGRDGQPDICDICFAPPQATCSRCRQRRPCNFATRSGSVTPASRSRWTLTPTPCPPCRRTPRPSPPTSSTQPVTIL